VKGGSMSEQSGVCEGITSAPRDQLRSQEWVVTLRRDATKLAVSILSRETDEEWHATLHATNMVMKSVYRKVGELQRMIGEMKVEEPTFEFGEDEEGQS